MSLNQRATTSADSSEDDPTESMLSIDLTTTDDVENSSNECLRNLVHRIQHVQLPTRGNASEGPPLIEGLDRVVFGTVSAAEAISLCGMRPPRYLCYIVSGSFCDVIQFGIDLILHYIFHIHDASICWVLGFGTSIFFRHSTHRYLVFGNYVGGYYSSLLRMYAGYSITIVLSTIINFLLTKRANISHYHAWIFTLMWTGFVNYFILKRLWSFGGASEGRKKRNRSPLQQEQKQLSDGEAV
jgi:putative flippase GtrA